MNLPATHTPQLTIGQFSGPIEALLRMVESHKMPINDISLAQVTDEYIAYINGLPDGSYSQVTHFLTVAATLLLIKSKSLLPSIELTDEEEESIEELQLRLRMYQAYEKRAVLLKGVFGKVSMYARPFRMRRRVVFSPDTKHMQSGHLCELLKNIFNEVPEKEKLPEVRVRTAVHISEMMDRLMDRITSGGVISLKSFTQAPVDNPTRKERKVYAVVGFLAMLEMVKNGLVRAAQDRTFADVAIRGADRG